jgi:RNA exonuclease 1
MLDTQKTGISKEMLEKGPTLTLKQVHEQLRVKGIIHGSKTVLVAHSIDSDMKAMKMVHHRIIDTSVLMMMKQSINIHKYFICLYEYVRI